MLLKTGFNEKSQPEHTFSLISLKVETKVGVFLLVFPCKVFFAKPK